MRISGTPWTGAHQAIPNAYGAAESDQRSAMLLKNSAWEHEFQQREMFNSLLRRKAEIEAKKKAAKKAEGGWGGLIGGAGGLGVGGLVGGLLAAPTGGMSLLAGAAMGGGLGAAGGGMIGSGVDQAMGRSGASGQSSQQFGGQLMDFSTEFLPTNPNPYFQAAMQGGGGGGGQYMFDQYGGGGMAMPPNRREY